MAIPKHKYLMDYIPDPDVYKAVMYARDMIRKGVKPQIAIRKASFHYHVDAKDTAHYVGQCAGRKASERRD